MFSEFNVAIIKFRSSCLWVDVIEIIVADILRCLPIYLFSFSSIFSSWLLVPVVLKMVGLDHEARWVLVARVPGLMGFPQMVMVI